MSNPLRTQPTLTVGLILVAAGIVLPLVNLNGDAPLLVGVLLCVVAAALFASRPTQALDHDGPAVRSRRGPVTAVLVLGILALFPLVAVGVLLFLRADPLAIFLVGLGLYSIAGVLIVTFLLAFFINLARTRKSVRTPSCN